MDLIIVESPTKAHALRGFLGRGYRVLASMGHIRDLPPKKLSVDVDHNFRPTYHLRRGAGKTVKRSKEAATETSTIYLATDPDREGEAIAWHALRAMKVGDKPVRRITFHEITPEAVKAALSSPGPLDMDLVHAQQARRVLDRLVGYQVSPVLWKTIKGRKGLSAGRVQTVALRLVVERGRRSRRPYPPYTTSTLQQDGANRLGWPAAKTMKIAQELYEGIALPGEGTVGLITYMRTDSTHVAESAQAEAREVIARSGASSTCRRSRRRTRPGRRSPRRPTRLYGPRRHNAHRETCGST